MNVMLDVVGLDVLYGSSQVLFGLKLQVHLGETLALLGRNGAGKSTSMKAIAGVIEAADGRIHFNKKNITAMPSHLIARAGIGFVPEDRQIFTGLSVQDNLIIGAKLGQQGDQVWNLERETGLVALLFGADLVATIAVGGALGAAFLNAAFNFCLGCEMYLIGKRIFS